MPKKSPAQENPLIPLNTPRDPQTNRIVDPKTGKVVGSSEPRFYTSADDDPDVARYLYLEKKLEELKAHDRLWLTEEEDPEVYETIREFDELTRKVHPTLSNPLSFHDEDWEEEAPEEETS